MKRFLKKFENIMAAVAFAEANEHDTAKEILKENMDPNFMDIKEKGEAFNVSLSARGTDQY